MMQRQRHNPGHPRPRPRRRCVPLLSRAEFERGAHDLISAFAAAAALPPSSSVDVDDTERSTTSTPTLGGDGDGAHVGLTGWVVEGCVGEHGRGVYLAHPPVLRRLPIVKRKKRTAAATSREAAPIATLRDDDATTTVEENIGRHSPATLDGCCCSEYDELLDPSFEERGAADAAIAVADDATRTDDEDSSSSDYASSSYVWSEWTLSVTHNETYGGVPVLYFTARHLDGRGFRRWEVLDALLPQTPGFNDGRGDDGSWDFVSEDEHPITGEPSYFLHPCRTSERMEVLLLSSVGVDPPPPEGADVAIHQTASTQPPPPPPGMVLLSWLSMVLPAAGFEISPALFASVRSRLLSPPPVDGGGGG